MPDHSIVMQTGNSPLSESRQIAATRGLGVSVGAIAGIIALFIIFIASDLPGWAWLYKSWTTDPNNSHGILVPLFSLWLLRHRQTALMSGTFHVSWHAATLGVILIVAGVSIRCFGIYSRTITIEAVSILPCLLGMVLCCGGWGAARWAWPSVLFLAFMIPLPNELGGLMRGVLQKLATISSTYFLQTLGVPAVSEGNVIWLTAKPLGVAEACSGIRMLTTFFSLAVGLALVVNRPIWQKCVIVLSAPAVAILANVLRITATALAYEFGNEKLADLIFHDLAGWLMMPAGLLMLWFEVFLLSKLFQIDEDNALALSSTQAAS